MVKAYTVAWLTAVEPKNSTQRIALLNRGYQEGWAFQKGWPATVTADQKKAAFTKQCSYGRNQNPSLLQDMLIPVIVQPWGTDPSIVAANL